MQKVIETVDRCDHLFEDDEDRGRPVGLPDRTPGPRTGAGPLDLTIDVEEVSGLPEDAKPVQVGPLFAAAVARAVARHERRTWLSWALLAVGGCVAGFLVAETVNFVVVYMTKGVP